MAIVVKVYPVPLVDRMKAGLWCPRCLRSSGYELPYATLWETGVSIGAALRRCRDCGGPVEES